MRTRSDDIYEVTQTLADAVERITAARHRLAEVASTHDPLPAPAMTEDAIVAALKADPAMAGRVIARAAQAAEAVRSEIGSSAAAWIGDEQSVSSRCLQSLAVALAAASYRG